MGFIKGMKKIAAMLVCVVLMLSLLSSVGVVNAAEGAKIDVVFAIDDTRSMLTTDPGRLSAIAINKFVDIMTVSSNVDIRLGITTYSLDVMSSLPLGQTGDAIKNFANTSITQGGKGTDAATGLNWAVNELVSKGDDTRKKAIILVGDGENSYVVGGVNQRTDAQSNSVRDAAVASAQAKGIAVYTLAINPTAENFRQYFSNIAQSTGGTSYEPKTPEEIDGVMNDIFTALTGDAVIDGGSINVSSGEAKTTEFDVPDGVFEMILRCSYQKPIDISFVAADGNTYNRNTNGVKYVEEPTYCIFTIPQPVKGTWKVTYKNDTDTAQDIVPEFIYHTDLTVSLSKNQTSIMQLQSVEYIATVMNKGEDISDDSELSSLSAKLVITKIDDNGKKGKSYSENMSVSSGKLVVNHAIKDAGKYEIYVELAGDKNTIKSNTITVDVAVDPDITPPWVYIAIIGGAVLLIILIIVLINSLRSKPGSDLVRGFVAMKIVARQGTEDSAIFPQDRFDCLQVFGKKNTLSDLVSAYTRRYRINNSGELAEMTLTRYINAGLSDVTDKILICGNKKKQTIFSVPKMSEYELELDGAEVNKPKKLVFSSAEKEIELRFKTQGNSYVITLVFVKE